MRWQPAILNIPVESDTDELGNEKATVYEHIETKARITNWTVNELSGLDPEYTSTHRKAILPKPKHGLNAESVVIDGRDYLISNRYDLGRWLLLHIRGYKQ